MSTDQILVGVGLILVLGVGSQLLASQLRIPALIILLPVGFVAGAITTDVNPDRIFGAAFSPLVSLAVAVILYDAGLDLEWGRITGHERHVVPRLVVIGVPLTGAIAALCAHLFLGLSVSGSIMLGAILVVSGPTVVGPLLGFVRPVDRLFRTLSWEGSLIDPVGAILGAVVFNAVVASNTSGGLGRPLAHFVLSLAIGGAGAAIGIGALWVCLCKLDLDAVLSTTVQLATVICLAAICDALRDDSGLMTAVLMGLALANMKAFNIPAKRPFFETLVQLILAVLFISISATVTPSSLDGIVLPTIALVAVLVVVARPLVALIGTVGTDLTRGERAFIAWMAPRGIVAAATASTFGIALTAQHIGGAAKILPVTFLVIVLTVSLYGLTAVSVANRLGVTRPSRSRPLMLGGHKWVVDLALAFRSAGVEVLMWAPSREQRTSIEEAGLELTDGEALVSHVGQGVDIEDITAYLLLTDEDHFNALTATILAGEPTTPVYRLRPSEDAIAPYVPGASLFDPKLDRPTITRRYEQGARIVARKADERSDDDAELLFVVDTEGTLTPITSAAAPSPAPGQTLIVLESAPAA